jgi:hypothetical protein
MKVQHIIMLVAVAAVAYYAGVKYPQLAQKVGL